MLPKFEGDIQCGTCKRKEVVKEAREWARGGDYLITPIVSGVFVSQRRNKK